MINTNDMNVAQTIANQIGNKALYMLGAQNLAGSENSLQFKIRGSRKVSHIKVELTSMDDYTITFYKVRKFESKEVRTYNGVYCDLINKIIENETGLYTSL